MAEAAHPIGDCLLRHAKFHAPVLDLCPRLPLGRLVNAPDLAFPVGTPLNIAVSHFLTRNPRGWVPILNIAQPIGVFSFDRLRSVPQAAWPAMRVEEVMEPLREEMVMRHSGWASEALERLSDTGRVDVMVLDDWGNLQGVVSEAGLRLALAQNLR